MRKYLLILMCMCWSASQAQSFREIKVSISNFFYTPVNCGVLKNISFYEAKVNDASSALNGKNVILYIVCKADAYPKDQFLGDDFYIKMSEKEASDFTEGVRYNFTHLSDDELNAQNIYKVLSLRRKL